MDIKEDYSLSDNETDLFKNREDVTIKTETTFSGLCSQKETEYPLKQIKCETVRCQEEERTGSHNEGDIIIPDSIMNYNSEMYSKIQIKEEPWYLETEASTVCDDVKVGDLRPVTSSRLCMEAVSGASSDKSLLPSTEVSGTDTNFYNIKKHLEYECQKGDITEFPTSEQSGEYNGEGEMYVRSLYLKRKTSIDDKRQHKCDICAKGFRWLSHLKQHNMIHEGKTYQCQTCDKRFTRLENLRQHDLIHEGKRPHQCRTCNKSFTQLSHLKSHIMIHEDKKPYQCKSCDKSYTQLSQLKIHNLIHEGKRPHKCDTCEKGFARIETLRQHNLIHEGKRPHQCKTCDKSFTQLSNLKRHNMIHEGKKPHQCKKCDKNFTQLSHLKKHYLTHEGKKQ